MAPSSRKKPTRKPARGRKPTRDRSSRSAAGTARKRGRRSHTARPVWRPVVKWGLTLLIWAMVLLGGVTAWYAYDLPDVDAAAAAGRRPTITLLGADQRPLATYGDLYGQPVTLADLPPHLPRAVIAIEDRRFYRHIGIDVLAVARAAAVNLAFGGIRQGGSTITQQLAKILFLTPQRTFRRKIQELLLAFWLERTFTKDQILALYLNRVYLGNGAYGVDAAARRYFGKPATAVTLQEAALLAGLLKAPSRYAPTRNPAGAAARADIVLDAMVESGFVSAADRRAIGAVKPIRSPATAATLRTARYFTDWVLDQLSSFMGYPDRDLIVVTTLDAGLQRVAESAVRGRLDDEGARADAGQAAILALGSQGAVRAMVGGRDYAQSQFNRVTQARRQPGSAFKLFVYLAGIEAGYRVDDRLIDAPVAIGNWRPRNYNDRYYGEVTLREGFARSLNSVAVRVSERVGHQRVIAAARRLGITGDLPPSPSIALGVGEVSLLELTAAYAVVANGGYGVWPYGIEEVRDRDGRILYRRSGSGPGRLLQPGPRHALDDLLRATVAWGTGQAAAIGAAAAGKTGTSQEFRDAWFVGYSEELTAGVWVGNDDGHPMRQVTGGGLPARLWRDFMSAARGGG